MTSHASSPLLNAPDEDEARKKFQELLDMLRDRARHAEPDDPLPAIRHEIHFGDRVTIGTSAILLFTHRDRLEEQFIQNLPVEGVDVGPGKLAVAHAVHCGRVPRAPCVGEGRPVDLEALALASEKVQRSLGGAEVRKVIVVPNKIVNIVVG